MNKNVESNDKSLNEFTDLFFLVLTEDHLTSHMHILISLHTEIHNS